MSDGGIGAERVGGGIGGGLHAGEGEVLREGEG